MYLNQQFSHEFFIYYSRYNADLEVYTERKFTAVHFAALTGCTEQLKFLLDNGAVGVNSKDVEGNTALHHSTWYRKRPLTCDIFNLLLRHGADVNIRNNEGATCSFLTSCSQEAKPCPSISHFRKLKLLGYEVNENSKSTFERDLQTEDEEEVALCKVELEEMDNVEVSRHPVKTTLRDVFFMTRNKMATYSENETLYNMYNQKASGFEELFLQYGYVLNLRYRRGRRRRKLMDSATDSLLLLSGYCLPDACNEKIFRHLNDYHLKKLDLINYIYYLDTENFLE